MDPRGSTGIPGTWPPRRARRQLAAAAALAAWMAAAGAAPQVLQVGTFQGRAGGFATIQAAVHAAHPGDWILIAPGDYHEQGSPQAGVWIGTPGVHLRGMDRNGVIVDGTNPGFGACSSDPAAQNLGPGGAGRNGIEVYKVDGVSIENLTACNFLSDANGNLGNEIWWNGGDGSGLIGMGSFHGAYLTASSTFFQASVPNAAQYGVFVSNARGPGLIEHAYASNMADSSFYIGACADCNMALRFVHAQNSALGYSGTNAGGHLLIEDSEWDHNRSGIVPSSLANDDPPSPQDGACPGIPGSSCTLIRNNFVHDNNNPNTPASGLAATGVIGSGIDLTGGRNNTVVNNLVTRNGSWGILLNDYPDSSGPLVPTYCQGGVVDFNPPPPFDQLLGPLVPCYFFSTGNRVKDNVLWGNGFFGNPGNADLGNVALPGPAGNCFAGNIDPQPGGVTSAPGNLQDPAAAGTCGTPWNPDPGQLAVIFSQTYCASIGPASGACNGAVYPATTAVVMFPIPRQAGMPDPCEGVPANSWCPRRSAP